MLVMATAPMLLSFLCAQKALVVGIIMVSLADLKASHSNPLSSTTVSLAVRPQTD